MNIFVLGDVVGSGGCEIIRKHLPALKKLNSIDVCIANGENSAVGNGITPYSADHLFTSGVDFITTGNHVFKKNEIYRYLDENTHIIRPYNMNTSNPGKGTGIIDMGRVRIGVINLLGKAFMSASNDPFDAADRALEEIKDCKIKLVDFHAEATGEKRALAFYLDGRVSAFFGTHTHVQTADAQVLPGGTAYITDLGMCGPENSVLGVEPEAIIRSLRTGMPTRFTESEAPSFICGCIFEIDDKSGKAISAKSICIR